MLLVLHHWRRFCLIKDSKYELICELARTKQSRVCIIRHKAFDCLRIAKFISKTENNDEYIFSKVNLIKNLRHPNIPRIIDIEEDENNIIIIKEYVEARTLSNYLNEKRLTDKEIAKLMIKLCNILEYMHDEMNLLHMDLKPDNIMIDNNDELWLIDLGSVVSKNIDTKVNTGSPTFAAPEQYLNEQATVESDIYGLGRVLAYICQRRLTKDDRFKEIIDKASKHEKNQRYKSVKSMIKAIKNVLDELEVTKETSKIIFVRGIRPGIGVTHICLSLAKWMAKFTSVCLIDQSANDHLRTEGLKGVLDENGCLKLEDILIIPNYNNCIEVNVNTKVKIIDCGTKSKTWLDQKHKEVMESNEDVQLIDCLVIGAKHAFFDDLKALEKEAFDTVIFANLLSSKDFYDCARLVDKRELYRIPCIYNWSKDYAILEETLGTFKNEYFGEYYWKGRKNVYRDNAFYRYFKTAIEKVKKKM